MHPDDDFILVHMLIFKHFISGHVTSVISLPYLLLARFYAPVIYVLYSRAHLRLVFEEQPCFLVLFCMLRVPAFYGVPAYKVYAVSQFAECF